MVTFVRKKNFLFLVVLASKAIVRFRFLCVVNLGLDNP